MKMRNLRDIMRKGRKGVRLIARRATMKVITKVFTRKKWKIIKKIQQLLKISFLIFDGDIQSKYLKLMKLKKIMIVIKYMQYIEKDYHCDCFYNYFVENGKFLCWMFCCIIY